MCYCCHEISWLRPLYILFVFYPVRLWSLTNRSMRWLKTLVYRPTSLWDNPDYPGRRWYFTLDVWQSRPRLFLAPFLDWRFLAGAHVGNLLAWQFCFFSMLGVNFSPAINKANVDTKVGGKIFLSLRGGVTQFNDFSLKILIVTSFPFGKSTLFRTFY